MPESEIHTRLVDQLVAWVAAEYCVGRDAAILVDRPGVIAPQRPPNVGGFIPDLYFPRAAIRIVGEAKTNMDIETPHSEDQIAAFLRYCDAAEGLFVLAVPWYRVPYAHNLLQQMCKAECLSARTFRILRDLRG